MSANQVSTGVVEAHLYICCFIEQETFPSLLSTGWSKNYFKSDATIEK